MYLFFGDERKSGGYFSMVLYKIQAQNTSEISRLCKEFKFKYSIPQSYEFHYHKDSRTVKKLFSNFVQTLLIEEVFYTKILDLHEPQSHICAFYNLIPMIAKNIGDERTKFVIDKLGGPKTEKSLRTEFSKLCRKYKIQLTKPLFFEDSKKSDFIQIADYLVSLYDIR